MAKLTLPIGTVPRLSGSVDPTIRESIQAIHSAIIQMQTALNELYDQVQQLVEEAEDG